MKHYTLVILSLFLSACGGGSGSSTESASSTVPEVSTVTTQPETPANTSIGVETMLDLNIAPEFDLSSKMQLRVNVDLQMGDNKAYLNICLKGEDGKADYNQCLLRTALEQSKLSATLMLANSSLELVAEIWFYDTQNEPLRYYWHHDNQHSAEFIIR
ncbi:hypothetical protein LY624_08950 [Pseudoalteromonas sp. N1230-9]|uniref:hypothetical protein n=1 Tax=Pseudoalteromonas sp. N1230-9 TaxID=2907156 RepID=UPI002B2BC109|nr:hypothetical protein LY624_08950 [Pseudoalteromonas sp. N1230-9]